MTADYSTDFDAGAGESGPWINWHAAPTRDGAFAQGTWSIRDSAGRSAVNLSRGFVLDWPVSKTGWMKAGGVPGVAPEKKWNASRGKFSPSPGDDWKKALWVPVAYTPTARAVWEQASAAAFIGFSDLFVEHAAAFKSNLPNLPLVAFANTKPVKLGQGMTLVPLFRVLRYVARPACLVADDNDTSNDGWADAPASPSPPAGGGNGAAAAPGGGSDAPAGTMQMEGHRVSLPTGPAPTGGGPIIDDEIPFGAETR